MKKIILIIWILTILTSCTITQDEIDAKQKLCDLGWQQVKFDDTFWDRLYCWYKIKEQDKVMDCMKEYTRWIDEKYNNPDTVTNLREDEYSNVVKTCNEIFWNNKKDI